MNPKQLLLNAIKRNKEEGSGSVAIVTIDPSDSTLYSSLIGDSGYIILRHNGERYETIHKSDK